MELLKGTRLVHGEFQVSKDDWDKAKENQGDAEEVEVNPDIVYPKYLEELGYTNIDQTKLEIARLCFTRDLQKLVSIQGHRQLRLHILKGNGNWKLEKYPTGEPLTFELITREYKRIRGDI